MKRPILTTVFALLLTIVPSASALFFTDFESDAVGANTAANPSTIDGFRGNFPGAIVRDSSVNAPFGASNQYLQFGGSDISFFDGTNYSARGIVTGAPSASYLESVVSLSFKFYETTPNSWGTHIGVATGTDPWTPDLNAGGSLFALSFDDGVIGLGANTSLASGVLPGYSKGEAYEITYYMNWTGESESLLDPAGNLVTLDNQQAAFWMRDLSDDSITSTVLLNSSKADTLASISLVFRNFNSSAANANTIYVDDLSITAIPEPSTYAALFGLGALLFVALRRRVKLGR